MANTNSAPIALGTLVSSKEVKVDQMNSLLGGEKTVILPSSQLLETFSGVFTDATFAMDSLTGSKRILNADFGPQDQGPLGAFDKKIARNTRIDQTQFREKETKIDQKALARLLAEDERAFETSPQKHTSTWAGFSKVQSLPMESRDPPLNPLQARRSVERQGRFKSRALRKEQSSRHFSKMSDPLKRARLSSLARKHERQWLMLLCVFIVLSALLVSGWGQPVSDWASERFVGLNKSLNSSVTEGATQKPLQRAPTKVSPKTARKGSIKKTPPKARKGVSSATKKKSSLAN